MKKISLAFLTMALLGAALAGPASAANPKAVAGVIEFKGKPTLAIAGTKRMETFQVTRFSAIPDGEDPVSGTEVPIYAVSEDLHGVSVAAGSLPGRCWPNGKTVFCRVTGIKLVIADLGAGNDSFLATKNLRVIADGGPGNDMIYGGRFNDVLLGGPGNDSVTGEAGNDTISGGAGNDSLIGDKWRDPVFFKPYAKPAGRDEISGGPGRDSIQGGAGADVLVGGPGNDSFENNRDRARDRMVGGGGHDTVRDPDLKRRGSKITVRDRLAGLETLFLGFKRYRLR